MAVFATATGTVMPVARRAIVSGPPKMGLRTANVALPRAKLAITKPAADRRLTKTERSPQRRLAILFAPSFRQAMSACAVGTEDLSYATRQVILSGAWQLIRLNWHIDTMPRRC